MLFGNRNKKQKTEEKQLCRVTLRYADRSVEEFTVASGTRLDSILDGHTTLETHCHHNIEIDRTRPPKYNQSIIDAHNKCKVILHGDVNPPSKAESELLLSDDFETRLICQVVVNGNVDIYLPHNKIWEDNTHRVYDYLGNEIKVNEPEYTNISRERRNPIMGNYISIGYEIGVCTIRAMLSDIESGSILGAISCLNSQYEYGHTINDRINYANNGGAAKLWDVLLTDLNTLTDKLIASHGIEREKIIRAGIVGPTPLIEHFIGPDYLLLTNVPYGATEAMHYVAPQMGLRLSNECELFILPAIDNTVDSAIISALGDCRNPFDINKDTVIQINLETECTVGLINNGVATYTKINTGNLFGGSSIECGAPYTSGAICHIDFSGIQKFETIENKEPIGLTCTALVDTVAYLIRSNIIKKNGELRNNYSFYQLPDEYFITTDDIQALRKAKMLIRSAIDTLCEAHNVSLKNINLVQVCGGFGTTYDVSTLVDVGIIPKELANVSRCYGDLALKGTCSAIQNSRNMLKVMMMHKAARSLDETTKSKSSHIDKYQDFEI